MRLINATTLKLVTFNNEQQLPPYAILSHRWIDGEEVLYKDLLKTRNQHLGGWWKIRLCCSQAIDDGFEYAWVDTCCIDKNSSAELSEAINSMYRWYSKAQVCYAYLNDVRFTNDTSWETEFTMSSWFTRSWTLQELLAPQQIVFYDKFWTQIGVRSNLAEEIAEASGIQLTVFAGRGLKLDDYSVAQRMSWASRRNATRVEDIAYSLLGIFDVNMPLLYGEGHKAFRRLQEEIIRQTHDHTIFGWSHVASESGGEEVRFLDLLAPSPLAFRDDMDLVQHTFDEPTAYSITNLGLALKAPLEPWAPQIYFAGLNCTKNLIDRVGIFLFEHHTLPGITFKICFDGKVTSARKWRKTEVQYRQLTIAAVISLAQAEHLASLNQKRCLTHVDVYTRYTNPERQLTRNEVILTSSGCYLEDRLIPQLLPTLRCSPAPTGNRVSSPGVDVVLQANLPCFGTIAMVVPPSNVYAVKYIKLGLDRDFNLVCILADSSYREPKTGMRLSWNKNYSRLEERGGKSFWDYSCLKPEGDWLLPGKEILRHPAGSTHGLWALKAQAKAVSVFNLLVDTHNGEREIKIVIDSSMNTYLGSGWSFSYVAGRLDLKSNIMSTNAAC